MAATEGVQLSDNEGDDGAGCVDVTAVKAPPTGGSPSPETTAARLPTPPLLACPDGVHGCIYHLQFVIVNGAHACHLERKTGDCPLQGSQEERVTKVWKEEIIKETIVEEIWKVSNVVRRECEKFWKGYLHYL